MMPLPKPSEAAECAADAYHGPWKWVAPGVRACDFRIGDWHVLAFEGTTLNGWQILRDIRFLPWWDSKCGFGPIGFTKGVLAIIEDLLNDLLEDAKAGRLIIVGHSLGGSLALRTAGHFRALGHRVPVYAFEPARCGLWKLKRLIGDELTFISFDGDDPVPCLPWFWILPGVVTKIGQSARYWWQRLLRLGRDIGDHRIAQVTADLKAAGL